MTIEEYKTQLEQHDWFYHFSDDHGVWVNGERESARIFLIAENGNADFKRAYNEAYALRFNTPSFFYDRHLYIPPFPFV
jgi:hypothetical protein